MSVHRADTLMGMILFYSELSMACNISRQYSNALLMLDIATS